MAQQPIFVVQEHHTSRQHFDFRLEVGGVLKSWAVPKGPSMNPAEKRLAIMVDDHPLDYAGFEGIIPAGRYGAGPVVVWDHGTYELLQGADVGGALDQGSLKIVVHGRQLKGAFALVRMRGRGTGKDWLLMKKADEYANPAFIAVSALTPKKRATLQERIPSCQTS